MDAEIRLSRKSPDDSACGVFEGNVMFSEYTHGFYYNLNPGNFLKSQTVILCPL